MTVEPLAGALAGPAADPAAAGIRPFDLRAALPTGLTVLEASAGTGKTWTIAALAARYVAEGVPLRSLLLVTFTRLATGELRERVRDRLAVVERELARVAAGGTPVAADPLVELLLEGDDEARAVRQQRIAAALADFDAATISTIHGFCQHAVAGLGILTDVDRDVTFVEDVRDLRNEIVEDFYIRKFRASRARFSLDEAHAIAKAALANPLAPLVPDDAHDKSDALLRYRFALAVRDEMARRKRQRRILTFDDQLTQLDSTLHDRTLGPAARRRLRQQYQVVLVDEFQDTDPVQWRIMQRAFAPDAGEPDRALVLIGDPKQAIYAWRGADVQAYLDAVAQAGAPVSLSTNWRSDQGLLDALDVLWHGTTLGDPAIAYRTVQAAPAHVEPRLLGAPHPAPLRVRIVDRDDPATKKAVGVTAKEGWAKTAGARQHVLADLAGEVVDLLGSGAEIEHRHADGRAGRTEPVHPGHLAVLVRTNRQASQVCDVLTGAGVPAVINGAGSVFATPTAREWLELLEALERPASIARVHAVARTCFIGWDIEQIAAADDAAWEQVHAKLHRWAVVLRHYGVASLLERVARVESLPARLLARRDGERRLTDLRHVGELLHAEAMASRLGLSSLTAWLRQRIRDDDESYPDEQTRRLESDADAVQVLTVHRSKGLEFPIVLYPFLWERPFIDDTGPQLFHDAANDRQLTLDVGLDGEGFADHARQAAHEQRGEDLRLLYVALTRARHQAITWYAPTIEAGQSAFGRLLAAAGGSDIPDRVRTLDEDAVRTRLRAADPGLIGVERTRVRDEPRWSAAPAAAERLTVSTFDRELDLQWRRTSYTALTAEAHEARPAGVATEPEDVGITDEGLLDPAVAGTAAVELAAGTTGGPGDAVRPVDQVEPADLAVALEPVPLSSMPGGAAVGSLVHAMFEHTDFTAADLTGELHERHAAERWRQLDLGDPDVVVAGLAAAIETPLGPLVGDVRLRDVGAADRLDELDFELPLVGGDVPTGELTLASIAALLRTHLAADDPLATYPDRLERLGDEALRGYLVGSIDLALRTRPTGGADARFTVVDYKTNHLGVPGEPLTAWHYRPTAMADAMQHAHYPLQALIYSVALHRYLRWRLPAYDPARHLGGVLYLFVRGMVGAGAPRVDGQPCGVFAWDPPPTLVTALSDAFDGGAR